MDSSRYFQRLVQSRVLIQLHSLEEPIASDSMADEGIWLCALGRPPTLSFAFLLCSMTAGPHSVSGLCCLVSAAMRCDRKCILLQVIAIKMVNPRKIHAGITTLQLVAVYSYTEIILALLSLVLET